VVSSRVAAPVGVASSLASVTPDTGTGIFFFVGLASAGSDPFLVVGFVSLGFGVGSVDVSSTSPPVPTTTPGGAVRTASSSVVVVSASPDFAASCAGLELTAAESVSDGVLEAVDPAASPDSSAQAIPLFQPVRATAATPKATAKPPTRLADALPGMRHVYRVRSIGALECEELRSLPAFVGHRSNTTVEVGREQQINTLPSAGGSTGSGS
jgi:hypothetical protein